MTPGLLPYYSSKGVFSVPLEGTLCCRYTAVDPASAHKESGNPKRRKESQQYFDILVCKSRKRNHSSSGWGKEFDYDSPVIRHWAESGWEWAEQKKLTEQLCTRKRLSQNFIPKKHQGKSGLNSVDGGTIQCEN